MPAATATKEQRELVRLLYLEHGHKKASELSGFDYDLVRQWAHRGNWTPQRQNELSQSVTRQVADRLQDELAENERETRLSLSRYARRASRDAEEATLKDAPYVKQAAQVAGIAHNWGSEKESKTFTLNVLNLGSLDIETG